MFLFRINYADKDLRDGVIGLFFDWQKIYGADTLEKIFDYIAETSGNKCDSSYEVIRNYFLVDCMTNHIKIYQRCPIYWQR